MNRSGILVLFSVVVFAFASCSDPNSPGVEWMPDMYRSPAFNAYEENTLFSDSLSARLPAENSIPRGYTPYALKDNTEDYEKSADLEHPLEFDEEHLERGKKLYGDFCMQCHGSEGAGDGAVAQSHAWPGPPPAYDSDRLKDLPAGKIYHVITYGKGLMGPHKGQISIEDRWKLVYYVQKLQGHDVEALYAETGSDSEEEKEEKEESES